MLKDFAVYISPTWNSRWALQDTKYIILAWWNIRFASNNLWWCSCSYMCINYLYCTTLCDSSFHMMFISFSSCSMLKPHVTFYKKNTYCNIYYCLSRTNIIAQFLLILLPSSENASSIWRICLLESTKMHLIIDVFAYWKVMKCFL